MSTSTRVEYGFKFGADPVIWPDEDGDLSRPAGGGYVFAALESALPELQRVAGQWNASAPAARRVVIYSRTITTSEGELVSDPLPKAYGSLVKATVNGSTRLLVLADDDSIPWRDVRPAGDYFTEDDLSDVELVFDAAGVTL